MKGAPARRLPVCSSTLIYTPAVEHFRGFYLRGHRHFISACAGYLRRYKGHAQSIGPRRMDAPSPGRVHVHVQGAVGPPQAQEQPDGDDQQQADQGEHRQ